jgi:endoglucanase
MKPLRRLIIAIIFTIIMTTIITPTIFTANVRADVKKPKLTVTAVKSKKIGILPVSAEISTGKTIKLTLEGYNGKIKWKSSDPYIAKVDSKGTVTGRHKGGTVIITGKAEGKTYTFKVVNNVVMRNISSSELVAEMKLGTNFARSLDHIDWNRKIGYDDYKTQIDGYNKIDYYLNSLSSIPSNRTISDFSKAGYNAIRLNVSFTYFTNNDTFVIDKEWLDVLELTVNRFLDQGMYCIIDPHYDYLNNSWVGDHWDEAWMIDKYTTYVNKRYAAIWEQVADRFKDYDDYVLFEAANEPCVSYDGYRTVFGNEDGFDELIIRRTNEMNRLFRETVRNTGRNNTNRNLVLALPQTEEPHYLASLDLPNDDHVIATVHYYYHLDNYEPYTSWSSLNKSDTQPIDEAFELVGKFMSTSGVPVILGEWGNTEKLPLKDRIDQAKYILDKAKKLGVPAFWWEETIIYDVDSIGNRFSLYNRDTNKWYWPELKDAIHSVIYDK